jgi:succinate dehydrogenase/fumarate reductase flavoprotein subunit
MDQHYDAVSVGAGLAGLRAAIELGGRARVAVISKVFALRLAGNDDAALRWNACARLLKRHPAPKPGHDTPP